MFLPLIFIDYDDKWPGLNFIIHDVIDLRFIPDCWS